MRVELDMFSGRENPVWTLSPQDARALIERVSPAEVQSVDAVASRLGFRGFIVSEVGDGVAEGRVSLPSEFRVGAPSFSGPTDTARVSPTAEAADETVTWLLGTASGAVDETILAAARSLIAASGQPANVEQYEVQEILPTSELPDEIRGAAPAEERTATCPVESVLYQPEWWNAWGRVMVNNCYAYAMSSATETGPKPQPGLASGITIVPPFDCREVASAAMADGCLNTCDPVRKTLVALVVATMPTWIDYHWYLWHGGPGAGFWAHKPGSSPVVNTDNQGRLIDGTRLTPQTCDRGYYNLFCGYLYSPIGIQIK
jgi:hypothetical protein